jgi:hypothetical protein
MMAYNEQAEDGTGCIPYHFDKRDAEITRLTKQNEMLVAALERFVAYGNVFAYKTWEDSPYDQAKAALAAVKEKP